MPESRRDRKTLGVRRLARGHVFPAGASAAILERMSSELHQHALRLHRQLPDFLWETLRDVGIADAVIHERLLGWDGLFLTVPLFDITRTVRRVALAEIDPASGRLRMLPTARSAGFLYGVDQLRRPLWDLCVARGVFECLLLESHGFHAVAPVDEGALLTHDQAKLLTSVERLYICFERGAAGVARALATRELLSGARIVTLPEQVGENGGLLEFFIREGLGPEDLTQLLDRTWAPRYEA